MRNWRKAHPHYGRDWQRRNRSKAPREGKPYKRILGAMVNLSYFATLRFVPKEQAERDFLLLTQKD